MRGQQPANFRLALLLGAGVRECSRSFLSSADGMPPKKVIETVTKNITYPLGEALKSLVFKENEIRTRAEVVNPELCGTGAPTAIDD